MCRRKQKRNALIIILVGAIISALICSECLILNTTASVPRGLWLKLDTLPKKGDFVQVPIDAFSSTEWVPPEYFRKIKASQMSIEEVINYIQDSIRDIIASAQPITVQSLENGTSKKSDSKKSTKKSSVKCPRCGAPMFLRNGKNGTFWGCSNYPECKMTANDNNGKPVFKK